MQIINTHLFTILGFLLAILFIAKLMRENRQPGSTIAWLLAIILIPYIGIPFYFLFGGRKLKQRIHSKDTLYPEKEAEGKDGAIYIYNTERILRKSGVPPAMKGNKVVLLSNPETAYCQIVDLLNTANHSIDITAFILGDDEVGKSIINILTQKAKEGVKVRLILDSLGCFWTKGSFVNPLREAGGRVGIFMSILPLRRKWSAHLRNHRKIIVVDNTKSIIGGMNFAIQYMGARHNKNRWVDFDVLIEGPLISEVCKIFSADWRFATGGEYITNCWNSSFDSKESKEEDVKAQIVASGPDVRNDALSEALLSALLESKQRIWITTPYFIPDEMILKTLALLSAWGRDVRIIIPARSNHILADLARGSYLRILLSKGVKIFFFEPGMLHSKLILIDEAIAIVGSANMDIRSLYLNYEIALFMYSSSKVKAIEEIFLKEILPHCNIMKQKKPSVSSYIKEWAEDISRLFSPFL